VAVSAPLRFRDATAADIPHIAALQNAVAGALVARFGDGLRPTGLGRCEPGNPLVYFEQRL
jgi:hypothetical protein